MLTRICALTMLIFTFLNCSQAQNFTDNAPNRLLPPHVAIARIADQIIKLGSANLVNSKIQRQLQQPLDRSIHALQIARPKLAASALTIFENRVTARVFPDIGSSLIAQSAIVRKTITELITQTLITIPGQCHFPDSDDYAVVSVGKDDQFQALGDAFSYAAAQGFTAVEFRLSEGSYRSDVLTITHHTRLIAPSGRASIIGRIQNSGPFLLELQNIRVANSRGTGIYANNNCATTVLTDVEVQRTAGVGIWQRGGKFTANNLLVAFASEPFLPGPGNRHNGRGLHLSDGVSACMADVRFVRNDAGAILADGSNTRAYVSRMNSSYDNVNSIALNETVESSEIPEGIGIIEVRNEALLLGDFVSIEAGEAVGLLVTKGAQAHLRYSLINRTRDARRIGATEKGGFNIIVKDAVLELSSVQSSQSVVGLYMLGVASSPVTATAISIIDNDIGIGLFADSALEASCALACINGELRHNSRKFDGNLIPFPDPVGCPVCISVPHVPEWCTD